VLYYYIERLQKNEISVIIHAFLGKEEMAQTKCSRMCWPIQAFCAWYLAFYSSDRDWVTDGLAAGPSRTNEDTDRMSRYSTFLVWAICDSDPDLIFRRLRWTHQRFPVLRQMYPRVVRPSVCLSHLCTLVKPLDRMRSHCAWHWRGRVEVRFGVRNPFFDLKSFLLKSLYNGDIHR